MYEKLRRNYKNANAGDTVRNIKAILERIGLQTKSVGRYNPYEGIHSLSIYLEGLGNTSNGKGLNKEYAEASGYAEFMERIQNSPIWFLTANHLDGYARLREKFGFGLYPDEKTMTPAEFEQSSARILADNFKGDEKARSNFRQAAMIYKNRIKPGEWAAAGVSFYNLVDRRTVHLPVEFVYNLCGTTGMCAGNDPAEALCQGMFEILERYSAQKIYFERLTPPDVPETFLSEYPAELDIIRKIEEKEGLRVTVKDFSAGMDLPVVGVILRNPKKNTYHVHCGAETSFAVALHRCLSEAYQNVNDLNYRMRYTIPEREYEFMLRSDDRALYQRYKNWLDWIHHGGGAFPKSVLEDRAGYDFNPGAFNAASDYDGELRNLTALFRKAGQNVYVRNNSFLGFPAFWVYVPNLSHESDSVLGQYAYYSNVKKTNIGAILTGQNEAELRQLLDNLKLQPPHEEISRHYYYMSLKIQTSTSLFENDTSFLTAMLLFYFNAYEPCLDLLEKIHARHLLRKAEAGEHYIRFHDIPDERTEEYFQLLLEYVRQIAENGDRQAARNRVTDLRGDPRLSEEILQRMSDKKYLLSKINLFPRCPNCTSCELNRYCGTKNSVRLLENVYRAMDLQKHVLHDAVPE